MRTEHHASQRSVCGVSRGWTRAALLVGTVIGTWSAVACHAAPAPAPAGSTVVADGDDGDLARKADIMHGPRWQRAIAELGGWLTTQTVYSPGEVRGLKRQFNARVAAMSSYEIEYLLDSIAAKLDVLDTPEGRDAKAWLGEYLSAMSDARRAEELRRIPNLLELNAAQLWQEILRIDRLRGTLQQQQQNIESRQTVLIDRAEAGRKATAAAAQAAAARARSAPAHSPYRQGGGSPPFSDVQRQPSLFPIAIFGGLMF
jgi:hypothetical protein